MLFRVLSSGDDFRESFEEKWQALKNKKIIKIKVFNLKSLLYASKRNNKIKLNTNKTIAFSQSLIARVCLIRERSLMETVISIT